MIEIEHKCIEVDKSNWDASNEYATKLHLAVKDNNLRYIQILIENGVNVQSMDKFGRTPLHWALVFGYQKAAYALIINTPKTRLDSKDNFGCTPLHYAAVGGRTDIGRILLEQGASIDSIDTKQRTPLHYAAQNARPDMVEMLVSRGANKSCLDYKGFLPFDIALEWGSFTSLVCLRQNSLSKNVITSKLNDFKNGHCSKTEIQGQPNNSMSETSDLCEDDPTLLKKKPSLEKLMLAWKNIQNNAKKKKDSEAKWISKAFKMLEDKLAQWREVEQEAKERTNERPSLMHTFSSTQNLWKIQSSDGTRLFQEIYRNRISQSNCEESTSNSEVSIPHPSPNCPLFVSSSPTVFPLSSPPFSDSQDFTLPFSSISPTPNELAHSDLLHPKLDDCVSSNNGIVHLEVGEAISDHNQIMVHDPESAFWNSNSSSTIVEPQYSLTSLATSRSPKVAMTEDIASGHNRFWWCKESNTSQNVVSAQQSRDGASIDVRENIGDGIDSLGWCTEWEFDTLTISTADRDDTNSHRKTQGLFVINDCDKTFSIDKGKRKAFFEEELKWVQVWPKSPPSSCSDSPFSSGLRL